MGANTKVEERSAGPLGDALFSLARTPLTHLDAAIDHLLETAARTLGVQRVGLWRYLPDRMGIRLQRQFVLGNGFQPAQQIDLLATTYPRYFAALAATLALAADDACADPRTAEFTTTYLQPLGIGAMLDVPVHAFGRPLGIICHEHVGPPRPWGEAEQMFAAGIGLLMSLAFEQDEHQHAARAHESSRLYDTLTGLPSRSLFVDRLEQALRANLPCAVLVLDLDRFARINESLGHNAGDTLLVEVTRRLTQTTSPRDTWARLGSDEFGLLVESTPQPVATARLADRLLEALAPPFQVHQERVNLSASVGIALAKGTARASDLLRDAEAARSRARSRGGARHEMSDAGIYQATLDRLRLDADLRHAIDSQLYYTEFQPIVALDGRVRGFEALVRWRHTERGLVPTAGFVLACEQLQLIHRLGLGVLDQALAFLARVREYAQLSVPLVMSVNVSPVQLHAPDFADQVLATLQRHALPGNALSIEITESSLLEGSATQLETLERLRGAGVRLYLDDFGTGYGFLTHLRSLPVAAVKVDRVFTGGLPDDRASMAIVGALVQLAHGLGLEVIAEGVETAAQFDTVRELGCDAAQGYWIARPTEAASIDQPWLDQLRERLVAQLTPAIA